MGKKIANTGCVIDVTITGGPTLPGFIPGSAIIVTPPSSNVKAGGLPAYSGNLIVQVPLVFTPPAFVAVEPASMVAVCTISPTGKNNINGKKIVLEGDKSDIAVWSGTAAATSPSPVPCSGTIMVEIASAGQASVNSI